MPIESKETTSDDTVKAAIGVLGARRARLQKEIEVLERAIDALQIAQALLSGEPRPEQSSAQIAPQTNRAIITQILQDAAEPLQVSEIARLAHVKGLINSKRGYPGVYATVSTVLTRNSKHVFMSVRRGVWGLRAPKIKAPLTKIEASNIVGAESGLFGRLMNERNLKASA